MIKKLDDTELFNVIKHLRDRRNRTREFARYKRHELRGQAAPSGLAMASGSGASESDGHRAKRTLLSAALKRANKEAERRRAVDARISNAKRALSTKKISHFDTLWLPATRTADAGMRPIPNTNMAPSVALTQEGQQSVLERSRKVH